MEEDFQQLRPRRFLIGEIHTSSRERLLEYVGEDQLDAAFDFSFLHQPWSAEGFAERITENINLQTNRIRPQSGPFQIMMRLAIGVDTVLTDGKPINIVEISTRYRSLISLMSALPGRIFLYNGEELALPQAEVPDESRQDPAFFRQPPESDYKGRDGCRVPIPWERRRKCGFSTLEPWLPMPRDWHQYSVDSQDEDPGSMLNYYREQIHEEV